MKKKILSIVLIVLLSFAVLIELTACDSDSDTNSKKKKSEDVEEVVEEFINYFGDKKFEKALNLIDWPSFFMTQSGYDIYEIEEEYDSFLEKNEDVFDNIDDTIEEVVDALNENADDFEVYEMKFKEAKNVKKVENTDNIYSVDVEIQTKLQRDEDDDLEDETDIYTIYTLKKDGKYYMIQGFEDIVDLSK